MSAVAGPPMIRWHITKTETLPFHFGFHEKKPISFEHASTHRNSLKKLDQHFILLRQQGDAFIVNKAALKDSDKPAAKEEHKYGLADELTKGGGQGAVPDMGMYEKDLVDQAEKEKAHEARLASAKTMGAENYTFDRVDEDITVAPIDPHILSPSHHAAHAAAQSAAKSAAHAEVEHDKTESVPLPPPVDDILNLPAKDETLDLSKSELLVNDSGVPVVIPIAEPVEPTQIQAVKEQDHPELVEKEEQEEEERAAAQGALASGSMLAIEQALLTAAAKTTVPTENDTTTVHMPLAEPVGTTTTTTLHAPHPSLDGGEQFDALAAEAGSDNASALLLENLRQQHEAEAAAAKAETERLDSGALSQDERDAAELDLMSRTKRLAALHERIIRQQTLDAAGPSVTTIKHSPNIAPTTASSRIMEIQQLHLAAQAQSALTVVDHAGPAASGSRTKELTAAHEQKIKDEADAKKNQDDLFAGKSKINAGTGSSSSSPRGGARGKNNNRKR